MTAQTTTTTEVQVRGGVLLDALATIRAVLSRRQTALPYERCVRLLVGPGEARLECRTGEVSMGIDLESASGAGDVWVDAQDLQRALSAHVTRRGPRSRIGLGLTVAAESITICGLNGDSTVATVDPDEMLSELAPVMASMVVDRETFVGSMTAAAVCAETGAEALPILTGIHLNGSKIECTDRYRLAYVDLKGTGTLHDVVVPAGPFVKVLKAAHGETLSVGSTGERITLRGGGITCTMRCIEGMYPKVEKICSHLEHAGAPQANLHREAVIAMIKPYAGEKHVVTFTPDGGHLEVAVLPAGDATPIATSRMPMAEGDDLEHRVGFNSGYLLEILKALTGATVTMRTPGELKSVGFVGADRGRLMVLQPVRIVA